MPDRDLLSIAQRSELFKLPTTLRQLEGFYTLTPSDLDLIVRHRSPQNRLGFAVQLCFLRYPGWAWTPDQTLPEPMLRFIALQIGIAPEELTLYAERDETRREHMLELQTAYGWQNITRKLYREVTEWLKEQARSTDQGVALVTLLIGELRRRHIVVPTFPVLERLTLVARALARRETYRVLTKDLTEEQKTGLDRLMDARTESRQTQLGWLRQSIGAANPNNILSCIER